MSRTESGAHHSTDRRDDDDRAELLARQRNRVRWAMILMGLLVVAAPILVLGQETETPREQDLGTSDYGTSEASEERLSGMAADTAAAADAGPTGAGAAASGDAGSAGDADKSKETKPESEASRLATHHASDDSVDDPESWKFDCRPVRKDERASDDDEYHTPLPPFSKDIYPCTRCHDRPDDFNLEKRNLTLDHKNIKLKHGPREQWCYGCHNPSNRDKLRLAGGRLVGFDKSYELCGQCHGPKYRDWRMGIHGKRIGCWNGEREYRLCVHCHSPHDPAFKPLEPKPRPRKPTELKAHHE